MKLGKGLVLACLLAIQATSASAVVNYSQGFTTGTDSWISRGSTDANGFSSFLNVAGGQAGNCLQVTDGGFGYGAARLITGVVAGENYTFTMYYNMSADWGTNGVNDPKAFVRQETSGGVLVGTTVRSVKLTCDGTWRQITMTGTIAATATQVKIGVGDTTGGGTKSFRLDTVTFVTVNPSSVTRTWDGGGADDNINTAANWVGDAAPVTGDSLIFDGAVRLTPNLSANLSVLGITFAPGASAFSITRPAAQVLTSTGDITNNSANLQTIGAQVTVSGTGKIINTGSAGISHTAGTVAASGFTKLGTGTLTLSGGTSPNLNGTVTVSAGTLALGGSDQIANAAVITVAPSAIFDLNGNSETIGRFGEGTSAGETQLDAGTLTITPDSSITGATTFYGGDIKGTAGSKFVKDGAGEIRLHKSGMVNTFERLEIKNGIFRLGHGAAPNGTDAMLGEVPGAFLQDQIIMSGGTLSFNGDTPASEIVVNANRGLTISGTATIEALVDAEIPGKITGTGKLVVDGGRTVQLGGLNDFSGGLDISGGLNIADAANVGTGPISFSTGGNLSVSAPGITLTNPIDLSVPLITTLDGAIDYTLSGDVDLGSVGTSPRVNVPAGTVTMSGSLTNTLGLVKDGSGTLVLSGTSTFTGGTTISNGTLHYTSTGVTSAGTTIVKSGGTLSGSGTVGGEVTIETGGTVSAGASPGTLNTGNLVWNGGGTNVVEVNDGNGTAGTGYDLINVTGTLVINATLANKFTINAVSLTSGNVPGAADNFDGVSDYNWTIVTTTGGITGFNAAAFNIPTANFVGVIGGSFRVAVVGNDLVLKYSISNPPLITSQPTPSQTVVSGTQVVLSATVTGAEPLTYVWEKDTVPVVNGGDISGADTATLTINNAQPGNSGSYVLKVSNSFGNAQSDAAVVNVYDAPAIVGQPSGATITEGQNFTPSASVTGGGTLTYTWRKDGVNLSNSGNISGADTASLVITSATIAQAGSYDLAVTNEVGFVISSPAVLIVQAPPVITAQPQSVATTTGATANFSVTATGNDLEYQWKFDGVNIGGATDSTYSVVASASTIGVYTVEVSNNLATVPSAAANLTINKIGIFNEPFNYADTAALKVNWGANSGVSLITTNGLPIPAGGHDGAGQAHTWIGSPSLSVTPTDANPITLSAEIWYSGANNQRNTVGFRAGSNPLFEMGFFNQAGPPAANGLSARFVGIGANESWRELVSYTTLGTGAANARWIRVIATFNTDDITVAYDLDANGSIEGSINSSGTHAAKTYNDLRFGGPSASSSTGGAFMVDNIEITTPAPVLSITGQPTSVSTNAGSQVVFTVTAPTATVYQWRKDGVDLANATDSSLTLNSVLKADEGSYTVYIENGYSFVTSTAATLTVADPAINSQPASVIVADGGNASFTVVAAGTGTLSYQWYHGANPIGSATDATYSITGATFSDEGNYTVVVTGDEGFVTSDVATLDVQTVLAANGPANQSVNEGASITLSVTVTSGEAPISYQWFLEGNPILNATDASYQITGATPAHGGNYTVGVTNAVGGLLTAPGLLTVVPDTTAPVLKLVAPKANAIYTSASLMLTGTVLDAVGVANVQYNLNNGGLTGADVAFVANGKASNWTKSVTLSPGTNELVVTASDLKGNLTTLPAIKFFYHTPSMLVIQTNLNGTVITTNGVGAVLNTISAALYSGNNTNLFVGRTYTLKALETGAPKYILTNWTATWTGQATPVELQTNSLACTFEMKEGMVLSANYIDNPFYRFGGVYNGLFSESAGVEFESAGFITMKVTPKMTFSAKVIVDGNPVAIAGKLKIDGTGTAVSKVRLAKMDKPELTLNLAMDFAGGTDSLTGTLVQPTGASNWTANVLAYRSPWTTNVVDLPLSFTNNYTMLIPGFDTVPEGPSGSGSAVIKVDIKGKATLGGVAADMQPLKQSVLISKTGYVPFFSPLYKTARLNGLGKPVVETEGFAMGWLQLTNNNGVGPMAPVGDVHWIKTGWTNSTYAAGFTNSAKAVTGAVWSFDALNPAATLPGLTRVQLDFLDGDLTSSFANTWDVTVKATFAAIKTNAYTNFEKAALTPKTGLVKGQFVHPSSLAITKYQGVMLQPTQTGAGTFVGPSNGGKVTVAAPTP